MSHACSRPYSSLATAVLIAGCLAAATARGQQTTSTADNAARPFNSPLITKWGAQVTAANAWREYPRPQLKRSNWTNLNGHWDYAVTADTRQAAPANWQGKILVPFCLESKLGGVQRLLQPNEALWYRRTFAIPKRRDSTRTILNFEAVDYECQVWVNGKLVGNHRGGHTPFSFDISDQLENGENELLVRVTDKTEGWQLRGKQVLEPKGIWYTRVSGIWQTVWLEEVDKTYITDVKIATDAESGRIEIDLEVDGKAPVETIRIVVRDGSRIVTKIEHQPTPAGVPIPSITIPQAKLWSPQSPHLYDLTITLLTKDGKTIDQIESYAGIRTVDKTRDADGRLRFTLNGEIIFHFGPLDQGWWPDGLLTPPSDAALKSDIEFLKAAGFNMIRKHIKVEPRRFYYHCDRLGMMVWQDHVSGGVKPKWTRLKPNPKDADWPDEHHQQFMLELERMVDHLENHPSIVVWVPFNEAWGQHRTMEVGDAMPGLDIDRLVNIASGGNFWPVGDIVDHHQYPHPGFPFAPNRYKDFVKVVGEYGGHGLVIPDHIWDPNRRNWGYGGLPKNAQEYRRRYIKSLELLNELRSQGIAAGVYTQTSDVEGEVNGLLTYDRKVSKLSAKELAKLHRELLRPAPGEK